MLYVKIMSGEDMPDTMQNKNFTIVPVEDDQIMRFIPNPVQDSGLEEPRFALEVHSPDGGIETHELTGNAYVMNEAGKTIASHGA
jgi:hypothetical protein